MTTNELELVNILSGAKDLEKALESTIYIIIDFLSQCE